jgi:hypothetical protein
MESGTAHNREALSSRFRRVNAMGKLNPEYLRQYELCKRMANQAKLPEQKRAWLDVASSWHALAGSPRDVIQAGQTAARRSGPALHLKRLAGLTR